MSKRFAPPLIIVILLSVTAACRSVPPAPVAAPVASPRSAEAILADIDAVTFPQWNEERAGDKEWEAEHRARVKEASHRKGRLTLELEAAHPEHERVAKLLDERWMRMLWGHEPLIEELRAELDRFVARRGSDGVAIMARYRRAQIVLRETLYGAGRDVPVALAAVEEFIAAVPSDERPASLLMQVASSFPAGDPQQRALFERVIAEYPDSSDAVFAAGLIRQADSIGQPFDLAFTCAFSGDEIDIAAMRDKVVLIDFWATWCAPCVAKMPSYKTFYGKYRDQGLEIIGVSLDQPEEEGGLARMLNFIEESEIPWPQYYQGNGWESEFSLGWGIRTIPTTFIIDRDGLLHEAMVGGATEDIILALLGEKESPVADDPLLERVQAVVDRWNEAWWGDRDTDIDAAAKAAVEGLDLDELGGAHLAILLGHHAMADSSGIAEAARTRLRAFVGADGVDGAAAAVMLFRERVRDAEAVEEKARLYRETLRHPALLEAARLGAARDIFHIGPPRSRDLLNLVAEDIISLERLLVQEAAVELSASYDWFFGTLVELSEAGFEVEVQAIRRRMVALAQDALPQIAEAKKRTYVQGVIDHLSGAASRGELLDHPAPEIAFQWSSDPAIASLADLKGQVVVLEFWATWCGPCVAAIPKKRELHEHYADKPVAIIGATTLDPHFVTADRGVEMVEGKPERAYELMAEYINAKDITWPIVYCDERAKAEFGVRGIPSIALIDAAGVVRHVGLHPARDEELRAKIDALLSEKYQ